MTRPDGTGRNLVGGLIHSGRGSVPGLMEVSTMPKAEANGTYILNGRHFKIRKGDPLPDGAELIPAEPVKEERAQQAAPENKAKQAAPENKAKQAAPETKAKGH